MFAHAVEWHTRTPGMTEKLKFLEVGAIEAENLQLGARKVDGPPL